MHIKDKIDAIKGLIKSIPQNNREDFHNPVLSFLTLCAKTRAANNSLPTEDELREIIKVSVAMSPPSDQSLWLRNLIEIAKSTPGITTPSYQPNSLLEVASVQSRAATTFIEREQQQSFATAKIVNDEKGLPELSAVICADKSSAENIIDVFKAQTSFANTCIIALSGARDGEYLALGYINEDITTTHVFQALKWAGLKLDEQAEAQLEAFRNNESELCPLDSKAFEIFKQLPYLGIGTEAKDLTQLHAQPHRYDLEALDGSIEIS